MHCTCKNNGNGVKFVQYSKLTVTLNVVSLLAKSVVLVKQLREFMRMIQPDESGWVIE